MRSAFSRASLNIGVPHRGQNERRMWFPLSAMLSQPSSSPSTRTASRGTSICTAALPVLQYWQSRHQQSRTAKGSALSV